MLPILGHFPIVLKYNPTLSDHARLRRIDGSRPWAHVYFFALSLEFTPNPPKPTLIFCLKPNTLII
ncbi:hypothetical protein C8R31_10237 [Nitrosospira sp. Nsp2]|nr:hypothetical protein C8R31_10237 [Nitrosospira sp. Nsp2]